MNEKMKRLQATIASLSTDLKPLVEKNKGEGLSDDEGIKYDDLLTQLNAAGEDFVKERGRYQAGLAAEAQIKASTEPGEKRDIIASPAAVAQFKSLGERFTESDEFKAALKTRDGSMKGNPFKADDLLEEKALIYSGTGTANMLPAQVMPGIYRGFERTSAVRQALAAGRTSSDVVTFIRELSFTNAAVEVAEATTVSGGDKPESAITFEEDSALIQNIAHWIPITRRMLEDIPMMQTYVDGRLRDGLERRIDDELINGNGTPPNISGLLDQTGLTVADASYFSGAAVNDAGSDNENPNRIRRAKRLVRTTGLATPTFILANPADVEKWDTVTDDNGQYLFGGPTTNGGLSRMWGLPIYEDEYLAAGTAIVGDGNAAAVIDRTDAAVYTTDSHSDYFIRNIFVLLAEVRLTLAVFRPSAFVVVTLA